MDYIDLALYGVYATIFFVGWRNAKTLGIVLALLVSLAVPCMLFYALEDIIFQSIVWALGVSIQTRYRMIVGDIYFSRETWFVPLPGYWEIVLISVLVSKVFVFLLYFRVWESNVYLIQERGYSGYLIVCLVTFMIFNVQMYNVGAVVRHGPLSMWYTWTPYM